MDKLLLVDGSNLLFQMFFGMPARIVNRNGKAVHGTLGFAGALLKIIRMTNPSHVAVLFDGEHENARAALDPAYKANRPDYSQAEEDDNPFSQLPDIYAVLDRLGVKRAETTVCETDDWMAGYVHVYGKEMHVVISSFDSDYFQLLSEHVSVLRYRGVKTALFTPEVLIERLAVTPAQYADYKSLVGDASDNIRGAEKIGPKTAAALLKQYNTLEEIIAHADDIGQPAVRASVLRNAERLRDNYRLIKLTGDAPLPFTLSELAWRGTPPSSTQLLTAAGLLP